MEQDELDLLDATLQLYIQRTQELRLLTATNTAYAWELALNKSINLVTQMANLASVFAVAHERMENASR